MLGDSEEEAGPARGVLRLLPSGALPRRLERSAPELLDLEAGGTLQTELLEYWQRALKHRWIILSTIIVCLVIGAAVTLLTRPTYTAQATLQIDREAAKVVNVQDVTPSDELVSAEEFFQTQYGLLRARSLAERVSQSLGLSQNDDFITRMGGKPPESSIRGGPTAAKDREEQVVWLLQHNLGVVPTRGSRLVTLTFDSPDPNLSAQVTNAFAENFITANLDRRFESSSYARDFLEGQLAQVKAKLEDQERELVAYATSQQIIELNDSTQPNAPPEQTSLAAASLQALNTDLAAATADRIQKEQRWRQATSGNGLGIPEILQSPTIQQLSEARAEKVSDYQNKLAIYKPDYPDMLQLKAQIDELDKQINLQAASIRQSLQAQYTASLNSERALEAKVGGLKASVLDVRNRSIQYNILQREVDTSRTLYDGLLQRYKEVGIAGGVTTNNISVVDRAEPPTKASKPRPVLNMALAGVAGVALGLFLAFLIEALDQAVRVPADAEAKLGLPVLGSIPLLAKGIQPAEALADVRSPMSESYFSLRSALQFSTKDGFPKTLLITSTRPTEGKSTTAAALAERTARLGSRTLLIDADLRNRSLHKAFGGDNRHGLSNLLIGDATLGEVIQPTSTPSLSLVTAGPLPPNPAELLAGERLRTTLAEAVRLYDVVIIDGPPVMGLADAPLIGSLVEGALLVIEAGRTNKTQARAAVRRLQLANVHLVGVVLTKFNARSASYGYGYAYEYHYSYGEEPKVGRAQSSLRRIEKRIRRLIRN